MRSSLLLALLLCLAAPPLHAQDWRAVRDVLHRTGTVEDGVLRVDDPKTKAHGHEAPTSLVDEKNRVGETLR